MNESIRHVFVETVKSYPPQRLVYVDECGIDQYLYREYAYSARGQKVIAKVSGKKFKRTNIVAGISCGKWIAPLEYSGTTDSALFEFWFKNCLLKEVEPQSIIILDNATFHKKSILSELAKQNNCCVLFLPPYSPDLNPIEKKWAWLKKRLRKILPSVLSFDLALSCCF